MPLKQYVKNRNHSLLCAWNKTKKSKVFMNVVFRQIDHDIRDERNPIAISVSTTVDTKIPLLTRPPLNSYRPETAKSTVIVAPPIAIASEVGIFVLAKNSKVERPK